ncbi:hypothetical protein B0T22DRAFT_439086 [Podospora appendiculata]|uniref:Pre-PUA domain-containing protein n=1 Tax=Podospora appendiculata TaxID=314037 RepID=A0AAE1CBG8_9PEZI|nr:hypothetical protein B0T22DRAFT_439086 [Podospora appendiculata]
MFKKDITASPKQKLKSSIQRSLRQSLLTTYPLLTPFIDEVLPKKSHLEQMKLPDRVMLYVMEGQPLFFEPDKAKVLLPHLRLVHRFPQAFPTIRIDRGAIRFVLSGATLMAPGLTSPGGRLPKPVVGGPVGAAGVKKKEEEESESEEESSDEEEEEGEEKKPAAVEGAEGAAPAVPSEGVDADGHWSRELAKGEPVVVMAEGKEEACAVGILVMGTKDTKEKGKGPVIEESHFLGDGLWRLDVS